MTQDKEWKFVSPMMQNWALLTNDVISERHKNSALNHVSTQTSYNMALNMLEKKQTKIIQTRRVDKMLNTETCEKIFVFK